MNVEERERRAIREAIERLLEGKPVRSDGKLTIKSLAVEAGMERWVLYQKHPDLRQEFLDRIRVRDARPAALRDLEQRLGDVEEQRKEARQELRDALTRINQLSRALAVLALENNGLLQENAELEQRIRGELPSQMSTMRGRRQRNRT